MTRSYFGANTAESDYGKQPPFENYAPKQNIQGHADAFPYLTASFFCIEGMSPVIRASPIHSPAGLTCKH
jgi:hypothetical protein